MDDNEAAEKPTFLKRKAALKVSFCVKKTKDASHRKISAILRKAEHERTEEEIQLLCSGTDIVKEVKEKLQKRQRLKDRLQEFEDPPEVLKEKCGLLAKAIGQSKHLIVYTGAGISTAARIPDYRGSNGVWTLLEQGKDIGLHDLSQAKPTLTHMALYKLYQEKILKHIVSQNCDGLHLRSGLPRSALSEIHGNMFLEVCHDCEPIRFYLRLFDVTQHTARFSHETLRLCYFCGSPLCDTIVHFGERGVLQWPLNWKTASDNANQADVILCLGSSLKVLKKYPWLWGMDKPMKKRPQLFIVNLQWTPKDDHATLKINGKCDEVLQQVMDLLNLMVPKYKRFLDPIYNHATLIHPSESHTTSKPSLKAPKDTYQDLISLDNQEFLENDLELNNEDSPISSSPASVFNNLNIKMEEMSDKRASVKAKNINEELNGFLSVKAKESCIPTIVKVENANQDDSLIMNSIILNKSDFNICKLMKEEKTIQMDVWPPLDYSVGRKSCDSMEFEENKSVLSQIGDDESLVMFKYELTDYDSMSCVDLALGAVETVGFSIPVDEFDEVYAKIHENLMKESKDTSNDNITRIKDNSVIISGNICDTFQIKDTHALKKTDSINDLLSSDKNSDSVSHSEKINDNKRKISGNLSEKNCDFCYTNYESLNCLFYTRHANVTGNFKERCCLCCENLEDSAAKERENSLVKVNHQNNINPGWFGKGYRKKIKKKK